MVMIFFDVMKIAGEIANSLKKTAGLFSSSWCKRRCGRLMDFQALISSEDFYNEAGS